MILRLVRVKGDCGILGEHKSIEAVHHRLQGFYQARVSTGNGSHMKFMTYLSIEIIKCNRIGATPVLRVIDLHGLTVDILVAAVQGASVQPWGGR